MTLPAADRGRLPIPDLDDRRWQDLVDEARALIPKYVPQWTDHNPSDLGITLIELFAWLVEGLIYKLNKVPEKNYIAFLNLLGITRHPQTPASTLLTFTAQPGAPVPVPLGTQAQTQASEAEPPVLFETDSAVSVAPAPVIALRIDKPPSGPSTYTNVTSTFIPPPPTTPAPGGPPTGSPLLGGGTLQVAPGASVQLCLGFDQPMATEVDLYVELAAPLPPGGQTLVKWAHSTGNAVPSAWPTATARVDRTNNLRRDGGVRIDTPSTWTAQAPSTWGTSVQPAGPAITSSFHWLRVSISNGTATVLSFGIRHLLVNTVAATAALTISGRLPEQVGQSDGRPFQVYALRNRPLFERPGTDTPHDHLSVQVGDQPWTLVDDLPAGDGTYFRLDPVTSEISFGNHDPATGTGRGSIPAAGSPITATYRYVVNGAAGNVAAGAISAITTPVPGIVAVRNVVPARGGSDEEPIEETKRRAPELLRMGNRAVAAEDYEFLAREVSPDVAVVRCLSPRVQDQDHPNGPGVWAKGDPWRFGSLLRSPGNVNLIIVPDLGPLTPQPEPSLDLVQDVLSDLGRRRDVAVHLHVTGARYLPIMVRVDVRVFRRAIDQGRIADVETACTDIEQKIRRFLHPVHGGPGERGWQVGESVFLTDIYQAIRPPEEIGYIAALTLQPQVPLYHNPPLGPGGNWSDAERPIPLPLNIDATLVRVADYELVCFGTHQVPRNQPE